MKSNKEIVQIANNILALEKILQKHPLDKEGQSASHEIEYIMTSLPTEELYRLITALEILTAGTNKVDFS